MNQQSSGKQIVINMCKKVISLLRNKCFKYGSSILNEKQQRNMFQVEDIYRNFQAGKKILLARSFRQVVLNMNYFEDDLFDMVVETQAGNCEEMSEATYFIMKCILPVGLKVQHRTVDNIGNYNHSFVSIKPYHAVNDDETLIIDIWPSYQIVQPQVVTLKDHFCGQMHHNIPDFKIYFLEETIKNNQIKYTNYDHITSQNDFNLFMFQALQQLIQRNLQYDNQLWRQYKQKIKIVQQLPQKQEENEKQNQDDQLFKLCKKTRNYFCSFIDVIANEQQYKKLLGRREIHKYVTKKEPQVKKTKILASELI